MTVYVYGITVAGYSCGACCLPDTYVLTREILRFARPYTVWSKVPVHTHWLFFEKKNGIFFLKQSAPTPKIRHNRRNSHTFSHSPPPPNQAQVRISPRIWQHCNQPSVARNSKIYHLDYPELTRNGVSSYTIYAYIDYIYIERHGH